MEDLIATWVAWDLAFTAIVFAVILIIGLIALIYKLTRKPSMSEVGDIVRLIECNQIEQSVRVIDQTDKKAIRKQLNYVIKDSSKKHQVRRHQYAAELYKAIFGEYPRSVNANLMPPAIADALHTGEHEIFEKIDNDYKRLRGVN
jgi:hypothetical protein